MGSSVGSQMLSEAAAFIAALTASAVTSLPFTTATRIVVEPVERHALGGADQLRSLGITRPMAFAAAGVLGTMLAAPARARRKFALAVRAVENIWSPCSVDGRHDTTLMGKASFRPWHRGEAVVRVYAGRGGDDRCPSAFSVFSFTL